MLHRRRRMPASVSSSPRARAHELLPLSAAASSAARSGLACARLIANSRKTPQRSYIGTPRCDTPAHGSSRAVRHQRTQLRALLLLTRDAAGRIDAPRRDGAGRDARGRRRRCSHKRRGSTRTCRFAEGGASTATFPSSSPATPSKDDRVAHYVSLLERELSKQPRSSTPLSTVYLGVALRLW